MKCTFRTPRAPLVFGALFLALSSLWGQRLAHVFAAGEGLADGVQGLLLGVGIGLCGLSAWARARVHPQP